VPDVGPAPPVLYGDRQSDSLPQALTAGLAWNCPGLQAVPLRRWGMTTAVRLIRSPDLTDAAEYAYAAVVAADSQLIFCAGACPLDSSGLTVGIADMGAQAAQAMLNLRTSLADSNASLSDVIRTTVYVASSDREDLVKAWGVVRDALAPHDPPSTLLGVAALGYADQLVEVDAVAAIKTDP